MTASVKLRGPSVDQDTPQQAKQGGQGGRMGLISLAMRREQRTTGCELVTQTCGGGEARQVTVGFVHDVR